MLECRKWGFKRWGFKEIRGQLRKKAFFLRFLDFPGALRTKKAEKLRAKKVDFGRFPERAARHPLSPHLLHPHLRQPKDGTALGETSYMFQGFWSKLLRFGSTLVIKIFSAISKPEPHTASFLSPGWEQRSVKKPRGFTSKWQQAPQ